MPLRFTIAVVALAAALAYTLFKTYRARPETAPNSNGLTEAEQLQHMLESIPAGRVMTFARLANRLDTGRTARRISRQVRALADQESVPWWRVVSQSGTMGKALPPSALAARQQQLLAEEGVIFKDGGIPLNEYEWTPVV